MVKLLALYEEENTALLWARVWPMDMLKIQVASL